VKILVTGGLGAIGSWLVPELRRRRHEVWVCDLPHHHDPQYLRCDVTEYRQFDRIFESRSFDVVYHLAAEYGRWNGEDFYETLWATNVIGTKNLIRRDIAFARSSSRLPKSMATGPASCARTSWTATRSGS
jgi:dTDP-glucose 4,6-dehydratase